MEDLKNLILLRGLPGSGKSTLANVLSEQGKYPVYSVDSYFTDGQTGEYKFEFMDNHIAYKTCQENTILSMENGIEKIFVDNTFTMEWEIEPYFEMASRYKYRIFVLTVENRHGTENIHNIGMEQLTKMAAKFKVKLIPG